MRTPLGCNQARVVDTCQLDADAPSSQLSARRIAQSVTAISRSLKLRLHACMGYMDMLV